MPGPVEGDASTGRCAFVRAPVDSGPARRSWLCCLSGRDRPDVDLWCSSSITHGYAGTVLAECIQTIEQAEAALALGVDLGQGWLFGRPVRPSDRQAPPAPVVLSATAPSACFVGLLARAVASSASGVVITDMSRPEMPAMHLNPAFTRITGYSLDDMVGRNWRILQGPETDGADVTRLREAIAAGAETTSVLQHVRKDGTSFWNELHLSSVHDDHGRLTHYLGFQYDVTDRRDAEDRLQQMSTHHELTGLLNNAALTRALDVAVTADAANGCTRRSRAHRRDLVGGHRSSRPLGGGSVSSARRRVRRRRGRLRSSRPAGRGMRRGSTPAAPRPGGSR